MNKDDKTKSDEKTEKDKMLAGELYYSADPELTRDRYKAKRQMWKYNGITELKFSKEELLEERMKIIKQWFGKVDLDVFLEPPFYCDYGYNIHMGKYVYMNHNCVILDVNTVKIGAETMFGPNCQLLAATHLIEPESRLKGLELGLPIKIGENCWFGGGVIVCPGVTIGDNVTVGAGSVVTKNIPNNVVAFGNPCKVMKNISAKK